MPLASCFASSWRFRRGWLLILGDARGPCTGAVSGRCAQRRLASAPRISGVLVAAVLKQYCVTCHNERAKIGGLALDTLDFDHVGPGRRDVGEGRAEDSNRDDAAERRAPAGARRARRLRVGARNAARSSGRRAGAGLDAPALHRLNRDRVRQRDPRSARAGRRRRGAAAGRRLERGIRQHRRSAGRVAVARFRATCRRR